MPPGRGGRPPGRGDRTLSDRGGLGTRLGGAPPGRGGGARWVGASDVPPGRAIPRIGLFLASKDDSATSESPLCSEVARGDGSPPAFSLVKAKANLFRSRHGAGECCKPVFARQKTADSLPGLPPLRQRLARRPRLSPPGLADGAGGRLATRVVCAFAPASLLPTASVSPPAGAPPRLPPPAGVLLLPRRPALAPVPRRPACVSICTTAAWGAGTCAPAAVGPPAALGYTGARRKGA